MKSTEIEQILVSLKEMHISDSHVMIPLQKIRNDAMATKGGVQRLVKLACVPRVLKLLYHYISADKTETEKEKAASESKISVALSIVANMLVDKVARQQVKRDGVETLVTLLTDCCNEEVHIRCCRSLGNLAMDYRSHPVMAQAKAVPALVKVLQVQYIEVKKPKDDAAAEAGSKIECNSSAGEAEEELELEAKYPSVALVEAACRILRHMQEDSKVRQELVEAGIVAPLSMLLKSEESKLVACVLRTMAELWIKMSKRITNKMASEVSRAGIMKILMELVDSEDDKLSHHAFTILLPLTGHPRSAALIGASDGVDFIFSHLDSSRRHIARHDLISGLCQLSREAVNRVKMREVGVLKLLLDTLKDDKQPEVHDRIISALVNFLYDDASLSILLEEGLVDILLVHLQHCGGYISDLSIDLQKNAEEMLQQPAQKRSDLQASEALIATVTGLGEPSDVDNLSMASAKSSNEGFSIQEILPGPGDIENVAESSHPGSQDELAKSFPQDAGNSPETHTEGLTARKRTERYLLERGRTVADSSPDGQLVTTEDQPLIGGCKEYKGRSLILGAKASSEERNLTAQTSTMLEERNLTAQISNEPDEKGEEESNTTMKVADEEWPSEGSDSCEVAPRQQYSMRSPTYQAETRWRMEDYNPGITCKTYGATLANSPSAGSNDDSRSWSSNPYSPLSTMSYHSPSQCSQFSPPHSSPGSSPAYSYATLSPVHSLCEFEVSSPPTSPFSPAKAEAELYSPLSPSAGITSPELETSFPTFSATSGLTAGLALVFSSSEDDDVDGDEEEKEQSGDEAGSGTTNEPASAADGDNVGSRLALKLPVHSSQGRLPAPVDVDPMNNASLDDSDHHHLTDSLPQPSVSCPEPRSTSTSAVDAGKRKLSSRTDDDPDEVTESSSMQQSRPPGQRFLLTPKASQEGSDEKIGEETPTKRRRVVEPQQRFAARSSSHASVSQNNILILLSRLSVCDDLNKHLANSKVVTCLSHHLALAREPHSRCVRVLSRILSSPHCLSSLLATCAPATLVKALMLDANGKLVVISHDGSGSGAESGLAEESKTCASTSSNVKIQVTNTSESRPLICRTLSDSVLSMDPVGSCHPLSSPRMRHTSGKQDKMEGTKPSSVSSQSESLLGMTSQDRARIGAQLLDDLSNQALSPYGEGVILHAFHRSSAPQQLLFAASLLFLQGSWSQERRQKFLFQKGILDRVLTALQTRGAVSSVISDILVLGITYLVHSLVIMPNFSPTDPPHLLLKAVQTLRSENTMQDHSSDSTSLKPNTDARKGCLYTEADKDLHILVSDGKTSKVLTASRECLVTNSSFFSAMLRGSFIESTQSQVPIKDTSIQATVLILHFLHGCGELCSVLRTAETGGGDTATFDTKDPEACGRLCGKRFGRFSEGKRQQLQHMLSAITLADRFNLPDLGHYLCAVVSTSLLDESCAEEVVRFAIFHELWELAEDGVRTLLLSSHFSVANIAECLTDFAHSYHGKHVSDLILSLVKQGVANTH